MAENQNAGAPNLGAQPPSAQETAPEGDQANLNLAQEADQPKKKRRYYSPNDVMKKKGCIGCGGMVLALILLVAGLAAAFALL